MPRADILADYQATHAYWYEILTQYQARDAEFPINLIVPKLAYMDAFLDMFLKKYKSRPIFFTISDYRPLKSGGCRKN